MTYRDDLNAAYERAKQLEQQVAKLEGENAELGRAAAVLERYMQLESPERCADILQQFVREFSPPGIETEYLKVHLFHAERHEELGELLQHQAEFIDDEVDKARIQEKIARTRAKIHLK